MSSVTRNDLVNANVLQTYLYPEVLENLRNTVVFHQFGKKPVPQSGYNTLAWAKFTRLIQSDVTKGTTSNDGTTPSDTAFNATVVTCTPFQLRIVVNISDMVYKLNRIDFLMGAAKEVGAAIGERADYEIQQVLQAGTRYIYASDDHSTRATLDSTDILTWKYVKNAVSWLKAQGAPAYEGQNYIGIMHTYVVNDVMGDSTTKPNWVDVATYTTPDRIFNREIGKFLNVRVVEDDFIDTLPTTNIYPTFIFGRDAYGVADFMSLEVYKTGGTASDSDPLAQRHKVGAKMAFNAVILDNDRLMRIESYSSGVTPAST